jgi:hypothetical protein
MGLQTESYDTGIKIATTYNFFAYPVAIRDEDIPELIEVLNGHLRKHGSNGPKRFHVVVQGDRFLVIDIKNDVIRGSCPIYEDAVTFAKSMEDEEDESDGA